jgi:CRISPR-associated protein Csb2
MTHIMGGGEFPAVRYMWEIMDADRVKCEQHKKLLFAAAGDLVALGWGTDMAIGEGRILSSDEVRKLEGERWEPATEAAATKLRVPTPGSYDAIVTRYAAFLSRLSRKGFVPVPTLSMFRVVGYRKANDPPTRRYIPFRLRHPVEDRPAVFARTRANCVAAMTRHTLAKIAEEQDQPEEWIDRYIHGHRSDNNESLPRFSYLPLPSIERRGERGIVLSSIRRVLVAELIDSGQSHLPWIRQMLPGQFLTDEMTSDREAMLAPLTGADWVLRQYTDPSDTWATVTPLVLPGSDEGKFAKAEKLFIKALHHAGYSPDALAELEFRNVSFWPAGELALRFQRPDYLKKSHWSVYHARLRWKQPIKGPLAIGAGRHCGLGVFAAMNQ